MVLWMGQRAADVRELHLAGHCQGGLCAAVDGWCFLRRAASVAPQCAQHGELTQMTLRCEGRRGDWL